MIKGKIYQHDSSKDLTYDNILKKVTDYDIFMFFTPHKWSLNQSFCSPLRKDRNPSFQIKVSRTTNTVYWIDYATGDTGNSIQYVQGLFKVNYNEALQKINECLQLGLGSKSQVTQPVYLTFVKGYNQPNEIKSYRRFDVWTKKFSKEELAYWGRFHITVEELTKYHVYSISKWTIDGVKQMNPTNDLTFGLYYPKKDTWKTYKPLCSRDKKWFSNTPITVMYNIENIDINKSIFILKSRKELMIFAKYLSNVCTCENESSHSITEENMKYLQSKGSTVYTVFDADKAGKEASWHYTNTYGTKHLNVPDSCLLEGIKDWAEYVDVYGLEAFEKILKEKNLI